MLDLLVVMILTSAFFWISFIQFRLNRDLREENRELLDRIMAKNLPEFTYSRSIQKAKAMNNGHDEDLAFELGGEDLSGV